MEDIDVTSPRELLESTLKVSQEKKSINDALRDLNKRVLKETDGDKKDWRLITQSYAKKGKAWTGSDPLVLDESEKFKDKVSVLFVKLFDLIKAAEAFNVTDTLLSDYISALASKGVEISIDSSAFEHLNTDTLDMDIEDELKSAKSYIANIDECDDEIREIHSPKSEDLNFAPKSNYTKVFNLYKKGVCGKDIDDDVQNILTKNEMLSSAVNLASAYAQEDQL